MKEELLKTLKGARGYVESVYEQERVCDGIKDTIKNIEKDKENTKFKNALIYRGIGIVIAIIIIEMGGAIGASMISGIGNLEGKDWLLPIVVVPTLLAGVIVGIIVSKILKKMLSGNLKKYDEQIAEQKIALQQSDELYCAMAHNAGVLFPQIPPKYLADTEILQQLYDILDFGRADSWKEALNVLEMDLHNKRMEDDAKNAGRLQEQMLQSIKNTEYQAQRTADMIALQNLFGNNNK